MCQDISRLRSSVNSSGLTEQFYNAIPYKGSAIFI